MEAPADARRSSRASPGSTFAKRRSTGKPWPWGSTRTTPSFGDGWRRSSSSWCRTSSTWASRPTEDLEAYFESARADYRQPDLITFTHAFVDPDKRGDETESHAATVSGGLEKAEDPTGGAKELGDPFMLQLYYPERTEAEISKLFGGGFAQRSAS